MASNQPVTLQTTSVHLVSMGVWGPIGNNMHALLIRHACTTKLGLFVLPGVIDSDIEGEIQIMLWTPMPPCFIPAGQRLAQLVPFCSTTPSGKGKRGTAGFGSTGQPQIFWASAITAAQLTMVCTIDGKKFKGLVDAEADASIIRSRDWPSGWPKVNPTSTLVGVGGLQHPRQSAHLRLVIGPDGQTAHIAPFIAPVPCTLWGRDVLGQFGTIASRDPGSRQTLFS